MNKRTLGGDYEKTAAAYLISQGFCIMEMNFRCRLGEIDIIAREGEYLVFTEVKYRASTSKGGPLESVNKKKQLKISRIALYYLMKTAAPEETPIRFDVIGIMSDRMELIRNAYDFQS